MSNILNLLEKIEEGILVVSLVLMSAIAFVQVLTRYVFFYSLPWSEELTRYLMIWMVFVGAALGVKKNAHITIDLLPSLLKSPLYKALLQLLGNFVSIVFAVIFLYMSFNFVNLTFSLGQTSPALNIPMYLANGSTLVGAMLITLHGAYNVAQAACEIKSIFLQRPSSGTISKL